MRQIENSIAYFSGKRQTFRARKTYRAKLPIGALPQKCKSYTTIGANNDLASKVRAEVRVDE